MGKRLIILSALVLFLASASAQQDTLKYRISLRETRELPAAAGGILLFFLLFLAYSMLRPVRETMGIAGGCLLYTSRCV